MTVDQELVRDLWSEYARVHFECEAKAKRRAAWRAFVRRTKELQRGFRQAAEHAGVRLDYGIEHLQRLALQGLQRSCPFCWKAFGLDGFTVVYVTPPEAGGIQELHAYRNLVVCCQRCGAAKGSLSSTVWIEVLAALKLADERRQEEFIDRQIAGARACGAANGGPRRVGRPKVLPGPHRPRVTRAAQASASCGLKK